MTYKQHPGKEVDTCLVSIFLNCTISLATYRMINSSFWSSDFEISLASFLSMVKLENREEETKIIVYCRSWHYLISFAAYLCYLVTRQTSAYKIRLLTD